ncbi:hypothetical protein [Limimaricola hongkongensis]|uniref:Cap15 family cyclic dinucleotide receptor domain-containing protein n=1 Tax=Limimaricola hongkongensis TaxID=278132 RepID=UPI00035D36D0|nr:hypothetical protein [Limimaricola hongkongensis]
MADHEYSVVGHSRARIGMFIAAVAGAVSGVFATLAGLTATYLSNQQVEVPDLILWPLTGSFIFSVLFLIFNKYIWRVVRLRGLVGVPDFEGSWKVVGQSYDPEDNPKYDWSGVIDITQCYEKITVHLRTEQSSSKSISAAVVNEGRAGYRLIYSYENKPDAGQKELISHLGHCDFLFDADLKSASGNYFNGGGRMTHGKMVLTKVAE